MTDATTKDVDVLDFSWQPDGCASLGHEWLSFHLDRDPGFAGDEMVHTRLASLYMENKQEWMRCRNVLKKHGVLRSVESSVKAITLGMTEYQAEKLGIQISNTAVTDIYRDAPVPDAVQVPFRWELDGFKMTGPVLWRLQGAEKLPVAYAPLVISAVMVDVAGGKASLELAWLHLGRWRRSIVPRESVKGAHDLVTALSGCEGFPVDTNNARELVCYLTDFEAHNDAVIPRRQITHKMGWVEHDKGQSFVAGEVAVGALGGIEYVPRSTGEKQLTRGVRSKGTMKEWVDAIAPAASTHRPVAFALYSSLATPLLEPLGAKCFVVDLAHKTSSGKTTALFLAASAWGDPEALVTSWDSTVVGFERRAAAMSGLPIFADDTKRARVVRGKSVVPTTVYHFADGMGRVRGSTTGLDDTATWKSIMLSTGEQRILDIGKDGGVAGRVLTLWEAPWGPPATQTAELIRSVQRGIAEHHGHAGLAMAEWLAQEHDWETLRRRHATIWEWARQRLEEAATDGADLGVLARLGSAVAVVCLAAEVAHQALGLPWTLKDPMHGLWASLAAGAGQADREKEALRYVVSWAAQNQNRFCATQKQRAEATPPGGWLGYWEQSIHDDWEWVAFWPGPLDAFLEGRGFEAKAIRRQWCDSGWLVQDDPKRATAKVGELLGRPRMIKIKRDVVEDQGDLGGDGDQAALPF